MSGRAIEQLRARQFDRCDIIRDDLEDNWLLPVTLLLVRVALATKLPIPAVQAVAKDLKAYISDDEARPMLFVRWPGGYIKPTAKDESDTVTATGAARTAKIITRRMAVQKVASIFGVDNVDQAVEALEQEDDEGAAKLHQAVAALGGSAARADAVLAGHRWRSVRWRSGRYGRQGRRSHRRWRTAGRKSFPVCFGGRARVRGGSTLLPRVATGSAISGVGSRSRDHLAGRRLDVRRDAIALRPARRGLPARGDRMGARGACRGADCA